MNRIRHLASSGVAAALLLVLAPTAGSTAQDASAEARKRCPKGSVAAIIRGLPTCLRAGQKCKRSYDGPYHRFGFRCHNGRLTKTAKPKVTDLFNRRVDVGGLRLAIHCRGKRSPTIILESGGGNDSGAWFGLEQRLAKTTRVCSYDRAGLGNSDARQPAGPMPAAKVVEELHTLLRRAGISPPYVLGGWSIGGFFNRLYTKRYPSEVLGLVAVDGTPIGLPGDDFLNPPGLPPTDLIGSPGLPHPEVYHYAVAGSELAAAADLGARPFVVLRHGPRNGLPDDLETLWVKWQKRVALLSSSSILVRAEYAGHAIQLDAPYLTAEAFRLVVAAVRNQAPLRPCSATRLPALGGTCLDPTSPG